MGVLKYTRHDREFVPLTEMTAEVDDVRVALAVIHADRPSVVELDPRGEGRSPVCHTQVDSLFDTVEVVHRTVDPHDEGICGTIRLCTYCFAPVIVVNATGA